MSIPRSEVNHACYVQRLPIAVSPKWETCTYTTSLISSSYGIKNFFYKWFLKWRSGLAYCKYLDYKKRKETQGTDPQICKFLFQL